MKTSHVSFPHTLFSFSKEFMHLQFLEEYYEEVKKKKKQLIVLPKITKFPKISKCKWLETITKKG
jgi:hypothetical protein